MRTTGTLRGDCLQRPTDRRGRGGTLQSREIRGRIPRASDSLLPEGSGLTLPDIDHVAVPRNPYARLATKLFYALRMPSFARERLKVLAKFTGIPEAAGRGI